MFSVDLESDMNLMAKLKLIWFFTFCVLITQGRNIQKKEVQSLGDANENIETIRTPQKLIKEPVQSFEKISKNYVPRPYDEVDFVDEDKLNEIEIQNEHLHFDQPQIEQQNVVVNEQKSKQLDEESGRTKSCENGKKSKNEKVEKEEKNIENRKTFSTNSQATDGEDVTTNESESQFDTVIENFQINKQTNLNANDLKLDLKSSSNSLHNSHSFGDKQTTPRVNENTVRNKETETNIFKITTSPKDTFKIKEKEEKEILNGFERNSPNPSNFEKVKENETQKENKDKEELKKTSTIKIFKDNKEIVSEKLQETEAASKIEIDSTTRDSQTTEVNHYDGKETESKPPLRNLQENLATDLSEQTLVPLNTGNITTEISTQQILENSTESTITSSNSIQTPTPKPSSHIQLKTNGNTTSTTRKPSNSRGPSTTRKPFNTRGSSTTIKPITTRRPFPSWFPNFPTLPSFFINPFNTNISTNNQTQSTFGFGILTLPPNWRINFTNIFYPNRITETRSPNNDSTSAPATLSNSRDLTFWNALLNPGKLATNQLQPIDMITQNRRAQNCTIIQWRPEALKFPKFNRSRTQQATIPANTQVLHLYFPIKYPFQTQFFTRPLANNRPDTSATETLAEPVEEIVAEPLGEVIAAAEDQARDLLSDADKTKSADTDISNKSKSIEKTSLLFEVELPKPIVKFVKGVLDTFMPQQN